MDLPSEIFVVGWLFVAAIASGLSGFAYAMIGAVVLLHFRDPADATPLIQATSVIAQSMSIFAFRDHMRWDRLLPFLICGLLGVPIGVFLLTIVPADPLRKAIGAFMIVYGTWSLMRKPGPPVTFGGRAADGIVGFSGGVLGGIGGLAGATITIWTAMRGWPRDEQRAVYQPYIYMMQASSVTVLLATGGISPRVVTDFMWAAIPVAAGAWLGLKLYGAIDDATFRRTLLILLIVSGIGLLF